MPPVPSFYLKPASLEDVVNQIAQRAVDLLRAFLPSARSWLGDATPAQSERSGSTQ